MSGIEVAGLVFGILPILIEVVKSYEDIAQKVRTVRHYSREVKSISEQLKVHNGIFLNEVRLLLRSIEAEEDVEIMLSDAADRRWINKSLNDKLRNVLRDSFEACCGIIEETKDMIETMEVEVRKFDTMVNQKMKVGGPCMEGGSDDLDCSLFAGRICQIDLQTSERSYTDFVRQVSVRSLLSKSPGQERRFECSAISNRRLSALRARRKDVHTAQAIANWPHSYQQRIPKAP